MPQNLDTNLYAGLGGNTPRILYDNEYPKPGTYKFQAPGLPGDYGGA